MTETYTRDSDKQKVIITEVAEVARMKLYSIKPIENNPMPELMVGDAVYLIEEKETVVVTQVLAFSTLGHTGWGEARNIIYDNIGRIRRERKIIWEAKK